MTPTPTLTFPMCRWVQGKLVVIESLDGDVETALAVASEYFDRLVRIGLNTKFIRVLWFTKSPYEPGVIFRGGVFSSPRAFAGYDWQGHRVQPWQFAREF